MIHNGFTLGIVPDLTICRLNSIQIASYIVKQTIRHGLPILSKRGENQVERLVARPETDSLRLALPVTARAFVKLGVLAATRDASRASCSRTPIAPCGAIGIHSQPSNMKCRRGLAMSSMMFWTSDFFKTGKPNQKQKFF
jgi:hypothetical protein